MFSKTHSKPVTPARKASGYFLFELVISVLMITAIAILAFPTYQDFAPEPGFDAGEISELAESAPLSDTADNELDTESALGAAEPAEDAEPEDNTNEV